MICRRLSPLLLLLASASSLAAASGTIATTLPAAAPSSTGSLLQVLLGLIAVLGVMAFCAWLLRRLGSAKSAGGATVRIVGGVSVGTRERVMVVEVADQWIVVGVAAGRVTALSTMPKQETVVPATTGTPARNFSNWLAQTLEKRNVQ
jgi:flagellar protein FliO/FliZ